MSLDIGAAVVAVIIGLSWLFRLESKVNQALYLFKSLKTDLDKHESRAQALETKVIESLENVKESILGLSVQVARLMEKIDHKKDQ